MQGFRDLLLLLGLATALQSSLFAKDSDRTKAIRLTQIEDRHWLLDPEGLPFFAHGITHAGTNRAKIDFKQLSKACKELGFNAYGYGCPEQLRNDMPFIELDHLVPISYYRGRNGVQFLDVFDPKVQKILKNGGAKVFSRDNNVIGYYWTDLVLGH